MTYEELKRLSYIVDFYLPSISLTETDWSVIRTDTFAKELDLEIETIISLRKRGF